MLFLDEGRFDNAHAHAERAKLHAVNSPYNLGKATMLQATVWLAQHRIEEARSEFLRAAEIFEKLGFSRGVEGCKELIRILAR